MIPNRFRFLRIWIMVILALLVVQFELGMATNLSDLPKLPPIGNSIVQFSDYLHQAGGVALVHAILGAWLTIFSVVNLVLALRIPAATVKVFGVLAFIFTLVAASMGSLFVQSGFQNDNWSNGMAISFILTFTCYFLEFYYLKPLPRPS